MNSRVQWLDETPGAVGGVSWLGDGMLGTPWVVKKWFPERTDAEWDQLDESDKSQLQALAQGVENKWAYAISQYKSQGACDATQPGRLAGALRAYLLSNGGTAENLGDDEDTFGPLECKEWMRVFDKQPDLAAAKDAIKVYQGGMGAQTGTPTYGWKAITLSDICGSSVKLPVCQPPVQPPGPECSPTKPCPEGFICENGKCVPGGGGGGSGGGGGGGGGLGVFGIVLLAGAAVGAIYLAMRGVGSERSDNPRARRVRVGDRVTGGHGADRDTGVVLSIEGDTALVAWDSLVKSPMNVRDLRLTTEHWSGGHRIRA